MAVCPSHPACLPPSPQLFRPPSHHICLEVDDIGASAAHAAQHARLLDPQPKPGAHGTPVVFLHPKVTSRGGWLVEEGRVG